MYILDSTTDLGQQQASLLWPNNHNIWEVTERLFASFNWHSLFWPDCHIIWEVTEMLFASFSWHSLLWPDSYNIWEVTERLFASFSCQSLLWHGCNKIWEVTERLFISFSWHSLLWTGCHNMTLAHIMAAIDLPDIKCSTQERSNQGLIFNTSNPDPGYKLFPTRER